MTMIKQRNIFYSMSNTEGKSSAELYGSSIKLIVLSTIFQRPAKVVVEMGEDL